MKKIINGKLYDTETAQELGCDGGNQQVCSLVAAQVTQVAAKAQSQQQQKVNLMHSGSLLKQVQKQRVQSMATKSHSEVLQVNLQKTFRLRRKWYRQHFPVALRLWFQQQLVKVLQICSLRHMTQKSLLYSSTVVFGQMTLTR